MEREEITKELSLCYEDLVQYLLTKYGGAQCDYFPTPECKSRSNKIGRTKEGLYCHHIDEDKGGNLSSPPSARLQPFDWQRRERLVYCNILEHLILHFKIAVLRQKTRLKNPTDIYRFFTTGGIFMICQDLNEMFAKSGEVIRWARRCFEEVSENYYDYILLIKTILRYIETEYSANKTDPPFLVPGSIWHFSDCDAEITAVSKRKDKCILKLPSGEKFELFTWESTQLTYADEHDRVTRGMASDHCGLNNQIYTDIVNCKDEDVFDNWSKLLKTDFRGFGFPQYNDMVIDESYGSKNADEYISKALPMHCQTQVNLNGVMPHFWKGPDIPNCVEDSFYIVRIKTVFSLKKGMTPFVRYRENDIFRRDKNNIYNIGDNYNLLDNGWVVLSTSDIYDNATKRYYSEYIDLDGNVVPATVTLSLGKNDYSLFLKRYKIKYVEILDGCYFS